MAVDCGILPASFMARRIPPRQLTAPLVALLSATAVHASPRIDIPGDCGSAEEYQAGLRTRLGAEAPELLEALSVKISPNDKGYSLDVNLGNSTRHIEDQDCRALFRAATVVAVALWESPKRTPSPDRDSEPSLLESPASPSPDASGVVEGGAPASHSGILPPPLPVKVIGANSPPPQRVPAARWKALLQARAGVVAGLVPEEGIQFGLEPKIRVGAFDFGVGASYVLPRLQLDPDQYGVRVQAIGFSAAAGWYPHPLVGLHGGLAGYLLIGQGKGAKRTQTDYASAFGPQIGIQVRALRYGHWWLLLGADAQLELVRPRFEIRAYREVFRPSGVNGSFYLGLGFAFD